MAKKTNLLKFDMEFDKPIKPPSPDKIHKAKTTSTKKTTGKTKATPKAPMNNVSTNINIKPAQVKRAAKNVKKAYKKAKRAIKKIKKNLFKKKRPATRKREKRVDKTYNDLMTMKDEELRELSKKLRSNVLSRVRSLNNAGIESTPALEGLRKSIESGTVDNIKQLDVDDSDIKEINLSEHKKLVSEILQYQNFLGAKTSTTARFNKFEQGIANRIGDKYLNLDFDNKREFWKKYEEFKEEIQNNNLDSDRIQKKFLNEYITNQINLMESLENIYNEEYDNALTQNPVDTHGYQRKT